MLTFDDIKQVFVFAVNVLFAIVALYLLCQFAFFVMGGVGYAFAAYGNVMPYVLVPVLGVLGSMLLSSFKKRTVEVKPEPVAVVKAEPESVIVAEPVWVPIPETNLTDAELWVKVRLGFFVRNGCVAPSGRPATVNELRGMQDYLNAYLHGSSPEQRKNATSQAFTA